MFNRIPSDVSEIVIVFSKSYDLYREMKQIVLKFNQKRVKTRIRDKLTEKYIDDDYGILYKLDGYCNRQYNKPYYVSKASSFIAHMSSIYFRKSLFVDLPIEVYLGGSRLYNNRLINMLGFGTFAYRIDDFCFCVSGKRIISEKYKRDKELNILEL